MFQTSQLRFAWRLLRRSPATSALAVLALALGIGLTASMASTVYGVLLSPVPFADPDRLMDLSVFDLAAGPEALQAPRVPVHDFADWQARQTTFGGLAATRITQVNLDDDDGYPVRYQGGLMSAGMLPVLGVEPALGRGFEARDDLPGAPPVVLLGHHLWRNRFAADPGVVGRTIRLDNQPTTVIGVMPPSFAFPLFQDLWQPLRLDVAALPRGEGGLVWVIGRLRAGVGRGQAQAELSALAERLAVDHADTNAGRGVLVQPYRRSLNSDADTTLMAVMLIAVVLVMAIACANVASLLLARASLRARELALRTALGARRARVVALLVGESLVLSALGAALGVALAQAGVGWLARAFSWRTLPFWISFEVQPVAIAFAVAAGLLAGLLAGLVPGLRATRGVDFEVLKDESRGSSSLRIGRFGRWLVIAELAVACALLVATGLMVRTVVSYHRLDLGFATESILTAGVSLPAERYPEAADAVAFHQRLIEDLKTLPEVVEAASMSRPPGTFMGRSRYALEGVSYPTRSAHPSAPRGVVSPAFFTAYRIAPLAGRVFDRHDDAQAPPVAVVNRSFAAAAWPGQEAVGKRLRLGDGEGPDEPWRTVVGVVPDAGISLLTPGLVGTTHAGFYLPHAQLGLRTMSIAVETRGAPEAFAATLRQRIHRLDPDLPVDAERTMERVVWEQTFATRIIGVMFSVTGAAALLLASVGIFGVMLFTVEQRTQEIGVRMALGAAPGDIVHMVLRQGLGRLAIGLTLGLVLAWALGSALRMMLFGVGPGDPLSYLATAAVLGTVVLVACYLPARRASRVDPVTAMRWE